MQISYVVAGFPDIEIFLECLDWLANFFASGFTEQLGPYCPVEPLNRFISFE